MNAAVGDDTPTDRNALVVGDRAADIQLLKAVACASPKYERAARDGDCIVSRPLVTPAGNCDALSYLRQWQNQPNSAATREVSGITKVDRVRPMVPFAVVMMARDRLGCRSWS